MDERQKQTYISSEVKFYTISDLKNMLGWSETQYKNYLMIQNFRHLILEG